MPFFYELITFQMPFYVYLKVFMVILVILFYLYIWVFEILIDNKLLYEKYFPKEKDYADFINRSNKNNDGLHKR
ncbi:hypothetical protein [Bacillus thuringiensis]|uniref:hypothetical protein n=1 Tax=Bacillus thuringiensis TaxID=1428 RepID=UPI0011A775C1|nr:hypothetical protein [Bacillus thuringiensis]